MIATFYNLIVMKFLEDWIYLLINQYGSIVDLIVHENFMMFIANSLCEVFCTVIQGNIKKCE